MSVLGDLRGPTSHLPLEGGPPDQPVRVAPHPGREYYTRCVYWGVQSNGIE